MNDIVKVIMNGQSVLEFHRSTAVPDHQRLYLDKMDQGMDDGIDLDGARLETPNQMQRAEFVARQLFLALQANDEARAAATFTYLADRLPDLKEVRIAQNEEFVTTELVVAEDQAKHSIPVTFQ
jgi:hypothetical protein